MSKIEWTEETWNPVTGCSKVSPGCKHCYAERMAYRLKAMGKPMYQNVMRGRFWSGDLELVESALEKPLKRQKPTMYFVNSMSDLFHEKMYIEWLQKIWDVMAKTPRHTYQILTKRDFNLYTWSDIAARRYGVLPNVWLGVSVENRNYINRIEQLTQSPAAIRFVSFEPLLGDVGDLDLRGIDWAIAGAESGRGARPMNEDWVRRIRDMCIRDGVKFFYKQNASNGRKISTPELDGRVWDEMPDCRQVFGVQYKYLPPWETSDKKWYTITAPDSGVAADEVRRMNQDAAGRDKIQVLRVVKMEKVKGSYQPVSEDLDE